MCDAAFPPDGWWDDFTGCGRYASAPTSNPKNLTVAEIDRAAELDHGFMWFVEQSETTPINGTTEDDVKLASQSAQMAEDLGLPAGAPHMFAVDTDGRPYMNQVRAAFVAYRSRVPDKWPIGAYAGSDVIDQLVSDGTIEFGHIPAALSWSSTVRAPNGVDVFRNRGVVWYRTPAAHLLQYPSEAYRGGRIDRNDVLRPMPVWYPGRTAPPVPPPRSEVDMPALFLSPDAIHWPGSPTLPAGDYPPDNGHVFTLEAGGAVRHVPADEFLTYGDLKYPVVAISGMRLKGMLDVGGVYSRSAGVGAKGDKGDPGPPGPAPTGATFTY